jgi:hypothetical protein
LKEVIEAVDAWPEFAKVAKVPDEATEEIRQEHFERRLPVGR